ncbi:universal stress protein [Shewanella sp. AS1]|uniref:universal stress protein n=1 Tax=Shewanella sp. AS1 TaxID=2907626 RepID=UPI001F36263E|nr:universal stress protein [Shewanella sp. AS1]MCE9679411.1 universal stress protein [Shewanella sp. AS1]
MSYQHILVAIDLSQSSPILIDKAVAIAKPTHSKLSFVFVDVNRVVLTPDEEQEIERKLSTLAQYSGYPVTDTLAVVGDLHMKLQGIIKENNIDLLVCGHHHDFLSRFFSPVPDIANTVEADLLVVYLNH